MCAFWIIFWICQAISWVGALLFLLCPDEMDISPHHQTKINFVLLLCPFGFIYFVFLGVKISIKYIIDRYKDLI